MRQPRRSSPLSSLKSPRSANFCSCAEAATAASSSSKRERATREVFFIKFITALSRRSGAVAEFIKRELCAAEQLVDVLDALDADDEGVHDARLYLEAEALGGRQRATAAHDVTLSHNLHPYHPLPARAHPSKGSPPTLALRIHVRGARVPTHLIDFDPVARDGRFERLEAVAGDADGAHRSDEHTAELKA